MDEISDSSKESNISMTSDIDYPEDPLNEPVYLDKKRNKKLYKVILERGEGYDKPGTIDRVVVSILDSLEGELPEPSEHKLGVNALPAGLEKAIVSMRLNEVCQVYVPESEETLTFKVKLLSWTNIHDLIADGNLIKTVLAKGIGFERIDYKDDIRINIKISEGENVLFEAYDWQTFVEADKVSEGLTKVLKSMKMKEKSVIDVKADYFNEFFTLPKVTNNPQIEIELIEMKKAEDINHDGTFYKRIIVSGEGKDIPNSNARVRINYKIQSDDSILVSNFEQEPLEVIMDDEQIPTIWSSCLKQMKEGDLVKVECNLLGLSSGDLSDGLNTAFNLESYTIDGLTNIDVYLELVSFDMGKVSYNMTLEERSQEAGRIRDVANVIFRMQQYERALRKYEAANVCLQPLNDDPNEFRPIHMILMSNISLCYLKMGNFHKADFHATKVIDNNPTDFKALLRRGIARREISNYEGASQDLKAAENACKEKGTQNELKMVQNELGLLNKLIARYKNQEKALYKNMFKE